MNPLYLLFLFGFCLISELAYFRIANRFNIIDKPNERSSHTSITIRGGGIVYLVAGLFYALHVGTHQPWFWVGFFMIGVLSFVDDVKTLTSRIRLPLQSFAVLLLIYQVLGNSGALWIWVIALILATGIINAYNFMDGINGITAGYSLIVLLSLLWLNQQFEFAEGAFIISFIIADLVFLFFNFRRKARCFAGDVGSVSIAFVIVFLLFSLIIKTNNFYFILLLAVYGVDSVLTIVYRLFKRENIFEAHRSHLYQWMVKPGPFNHLQMSGLYMFIQAIISIVVIISVDNNWTSQLIISLAVLITLGLTYILIKTAYKRKYQIV